MNARSELPPLEITVALAGRQNSGKTSLLMHLTGTAQKPVNFPGTSVERGEAKTTVGGTTLRLVDLPGIASIHSVTRDEEVAVGYLRGEDSQRPEVVCAVMDAGKLPVELRLLRELQALGPPVVVALTKNDVARNEGRPVDAAGLAGALSLPVLEVNGLTGAGKEDLAQALVLARSRKGEPSAWHDGDTLRRSGFGEEGTRGGRSSWTDRLDRVLLHRVFGLPLLLLLVGGIFQLIFTGAEPFIAAVEAGQSRLADLVAGAVPPGALRSFLADGLVGGLGSVLVFLPQIAMLIALVTVLEQTGYMARAAFLLDRVLRKVGLSGRSFVPLVSSFACAVPGILATRIIDDEKDRLATIVTAPLMSCSARLPVYVVLIGAFFPVAWAGLVLLGMYLLGIAVAAAVALLLRKTALRGPASTLMMELPVYQRPSLRVVLGQVRVAAREFLVLAGTVIFAASILVWVLSYYPRPESVGRAFDAERAAVEASLPEGPARDEALAAVGAREATARLEQSWLASFGKTLEPAFAPAGFDWRITVGILAAFPAREIIVPTLGILYSAGDVDPGDYGVSSLDVATRETDGLRSRLRGARGPDGKPDFDPLVALALMVFIALCSQCVSTLGTIRRETRSWRWPVFTFAYMTALAWIASVLVFQAGSALGFGGG